MKKLWYSGDLLGWQGEEAPCIRGWDTTGTSGKEACGDKGKPRDDGLTGVRQQSGGEGGDSHRQGSLDEARHAVHFEFSHEMATAGVDRLRTDLEHEGNLL